MNTIKEYTNKADGITSLVHNHVNGFSVILRDDDSGETIQSITIFENKDDAFAFARHIVGL